MDKKTFSQRLWIAIWPYAEIARLTQKCRDRSDLAYLWQVKHDAMKAQLENAQRDYRHIRRQVPGKIIEGKDPAAAHEARIEYECNRLRAFVNTMHRSATSALAEIDHLNKDLQRSKNAVVGAMVKDESQPG